MNTRTIEELAYNIIEAKKSNLPSPIFFLGAGASKTGGIPLANEIAKDILNRFNTNLQIKSLHDKEKTYLRLMECLNPSERNRLLNEYIENSKINVCHIYLAQMFTNSYVDYILTVNFDNLILKALSLFNEFPPTYDMAILKDLTTTAFKTKSVVFLHGQHHGLWLLNTKEEMARVKEIIPNIFHSLKNERPWIFVGYSGNDPIFEHITNLGRFDNGLYWVSNNDEVPCKTICDKLLDKPNTNSFLISGYDADSFMVRLNTELRLPQPSIIDAPFSSLRTMLDNIIDIDNQEPFRGVRQRLEIAKSQVSEAIQQFEGGKPIAPSVFYNNSEIDLLKKRIIKLIIEKDYTYDKINDIALNVKKLRNKDLNSLLAELFNDWGTKLSDLAFRMSNDDSDSLFNQAFKAFNKAISLKPSFHEAYNNWGTALWRLAKTKSPDTAESLLIQSIEKFKKALEIKPDKHNTLCNWGTALVDLAKIKPEVGNSSLNLAFEKFKYSLEINPNLYRALYNWGTALLYMAGTKSGEDSSSLYELAINKFNILITIKPNHHEAYNNLGESLRQFAMTKTGKLAESMLKQSINKFKIAISIKPDKWESFTGWGNSLSNLAKLKSRWKRDLLYKQSFKKYQIAIAFNQDSYDTFGHWANSLCDFALTKSGKSVDKLLNLACTKYKRSIDIKPDSHESYYNWGTALNDLAVGKSINEAETLYSLALEKFKKATDIKSDKYEAFLNWGVCLGSLARLKTGIDAEAYYFQGLEKFEKTKKLQPDLYQPYFNSGVFLWSLAEIKIGKEAETFLAQAIDQFEKAINLGSSCYYLACIYAMKSDKENAFNYLKISLCKKEINLNIVKKDKYWNKYLHDTDFKHITSHIFVINKIFKKLLKIFV